MFTAILGQTQLGLCELAFVPSLAAAAPCPYRPGRPDETQGARLRPHECR
jgi:hypothetical protein